MLKSTIYNPSQPGAARGTDPSRPGLGDRKDILLGSKRGSHRSGGDTGPGDRSVMYTWLAHAQLRRQSGTDVKKSAVRIVTLGWPFRRENVDSRSCTVLTIWFRIGRGRWLSFDTKGNELTPIKAGPSHDQTGVFGGIWFMHASYTIPGRRY